MIDGTIVLITWSDRTLNNSMMYVLQGTGITFYDILLISQTHREPHCPVCLSRISASFPSARCSFLVPHGKPTRASVNMTRALSLKAVLTFRNQSSISSVARRGSNSLGIPPSTDSRTCGLGRCYQCRGIIRRFR
jgi:hypothetical protein